MQLTTMSITRGLKELKLLGDRINSTTNTLESVDVTQQKRKGIAIGTQLSVDQFTVQAEKKYQSVVDLMTRRRSIKNAIVVSNANTNVKIGDREMTVADAIEERGSLDFKRNLLLTLRTQRNKVKQEIANTTATLDDQVNKMIEQNLGKDRKADKEDYDKIATPFIEANALTILDPLDTGKKIEALELEITDFENNVDVVLSESNSKTEINVK